MTPRHHIELAFGGSSRIHNIRLPVISDQASLTFSSQIYQCFTAEVNRGGGEGRAVSHANPGSSAAAGDSVAFTATNMAYPGTKHDSAKAFPEGHDYRVAVTSCPDARVGLTTHLSQTGTRNISISGNSSSCNSASGNSTSGNSASGNSAFPEFRKGHLGVGVSTYPDNELMFWTDTDESADEHHT